MSDSKPIRVAIVDYRLGNLHSVQQACAYAGMEATITSDKQTILNADAILLPGVGAYGDAMATLRRLDLVSVLRDIAASPKPFVGICLGVQLLMTESFEFGRHKGLGIIEGQVVPFDHPREGERMLKVPQIGWNRICRAENARWDGTLLDGVADREYMYFVHSYVVQPRDPDVILSTSRYGQIEFCSSVQRGNVFACQFHPERSGVAGIRMYQNLAAQIRQRIQFGQHRVTCPEFHQETINMVSAKILDRQLPILPTEVKFCKRCVVSNQRPRIRFDEEGICGACRYADIKKSDIDWQAREKELRELCNQFRREDGRFDVIVPASGGKDSSRVAYELKSIYGMHPLTVTWAPFEYTPEGYANFRNFVKVGGFNNLMAWPNGKLHRKLSRIAFEALGDAWQPFAYGQMCYAFHVAQAFGIKLVFFGENGEAEYSGDPRVFNLRGMPFDIWAEQYFKGVMVDDLIQYGLEETDYLTKNDYDESDLLFYRPPVIDAMRKQGVEFHWFSYYKKWVPQENYYLASEHTGFQANPTGRSEGTYSKYASLDDQMDGFHYYLAFIKFGIGRTTSDAAHEVRDSHITREEGAALVRQFDGEFPRRWFKEFLAYLNITEEYFWNVIDRYHQPHIWKQENGVWKLRQAVYDEYPFLEGVPGYIASLVNNASGS